MTELTKEELLKRIRTRNKRQLFKRNNTRL